MNSLLHDGFSTLKLLVLEIRGAHSHNCSMGFVVPGPVWVAEGVEQGAIPSSALHPAQGPRMTLTPGVGEVQGFLPPCTNYPKNGGKSWPAAQEEHTAPSERE